MWGSILIWRKPWGYLWREMQRKGSSHNYMKLSPCTFCPLSSPCNVHPSSRLLHLSCQLRDGAANLNIVEIGGCSASQEGELAVHWLPSLSHIKSVLYGHAFDQVVNPVKLRGWTLEYVVIEELDLRCMKLINILMLSTHFELDGLNISRRQNRATLNYYRSWSRMECD